MSQNDPIEDDIARWFLYGMGLLAAIAALLSIIAIIGIVMDWGLVRTGYWIVRAVTVMLGVSVISIVIGYVIERLIHRYKQQV